MTSSTSESTSEERTCVVTPGSAEALTAAPPTASTARTGCQVIRSRMRDPKYWKTACPNDADSSTTNNAPRETHREGSASPSSWGTSQSTLTKPPISRPAVAKAPEMNPCQ